MDTIKPIETVYNGYRFRSRLEARWAVFFDACGVEWEYEPEGYDLGNGVYYLPDFLLHGVDGRSGSDLYVEVKGKMTAKDVIKIRCFIKEDEDGSLGTFDQALLILGNIPAGENMEEICNNISDAAYSGFSSINGGWPRPFNFETIDGDHFAAHPGINRNGKFELFGDDCNYLCDMNPEATERAYRLARQARFEHGEHGAVS